tara:strand:- start:716 stop:1039 length:324 start_codon:yes stop_codon:yes gene_type:complete
MFNIPKEIYQVIKLDVKTLMEVSKLKSDQDAVCIYIFGLLSEKNGVKMFYDSLVGRGVSKSLAHTFLSYCLQMKHKIDKGMWTWYEIDEFDIPLDDVKICTAKYALP